MSEIRFIKIKPMPKPDKRPSRLSALLLWAIAAAGLVLSSLFSLPLSGAMQGVHPLVQQLIINLVFYLPFVVLPLVILAAKNPGLAEAYRPNPISLFDTICAVVLALLGVFFVNDITVLWSIPFQQLGFDIYTAGLPAASNSAELMLSVIIVAVIPAICEEFLFRGAILPAFEGNGTRHAAVLSALLFALLHGSLIGGPAQFLLGIVLALLVFWTDSVYAGLIYHTVHNAAIVVLDYLQSQDSVAAAQSADLLEALGGLAGVVNLLIGVLLNAALIIFSLKMFRMRGRLRGITLEKRQRAKLRRMEILILIAGGAMCALMYAMDIFSMLGGSLR